MTSRPSAEKRRKEKQRQDKKRDKAERRAARRAEKAQKPDRNESEVDPDIADIVPGPQPRSDEEEEEEETDGETERASIPNRDHGENPAPTPIGTRAPRTSGHREA